MKNTQYFYRNVMFSKSGGQVTLVDIFNPNAVREVLEPWFGTVLQLADGKHTIEEFTQYMTSQYKGNPPHNLQETINSVFDRLIESKLIVLTDVATELPYYLSAPCEHLDIEKAKKLLEQDQANLN